MTLAGFQDRCIQPGSATCPRTKYLTSLEAPPRFELGIEALQAPALPLGDGAVDVMVPGAGLEPAQCYHRGILSPLRLPISPSGHKLNTSVKTYTFKNILTEIYMERETRFELATPTLARSCSTTELFPHNKHISCFEVEV